jgi:Na+-translocating ferredoxin:NAD+ oxidoreductase RnfG subunit
MKYIILFTLIGAVSAGFIANNGDTLGDRIGTNIAKIRHQQIQQAVAGGNVPYASMNASVSVHDHIDQLQTMTPARCTQAKQLLRNAKSHYARDMYNAKINLALTRQRNDAC